MFGAVEVISAVGWGNYWFFDNLVYLTNAKFLQGDKKTYAYWGAFGWTIGLLGKVILSVRELLKSANEEAALRESLKTADGKTAEEIKPKIAALVGKRTQQTLNLAANAADLLVASNGIEIPAKVLGQGLNDGVLGACGLFSALVAGYYAWFEVNK